MSGGEREDGRWPFMPTATPASPSAVPPELPLPRFQAAPQTIGEDEKRKPLPRHIVKQILAANSEAMQAVPPFMPAITPASPAPRRGPGTGPPASPVPPHGVKQIFDASRLRAARNRWVDPVRLEMEARRRATKPERDKARAERAAKRAKVED